MLDSAASCQIVKSATLTKLLEVEAVLPAFLEVFQHLPEARGPRQPRGPRRSVGE